MYGNCSPTVKHKSEEEKDPGAFVQNERNTRVQIVDKARSPSLDEFPLHPHHSRFSCASTAKCEQTAVTAVHR